MAGTVRVSLINMATGDPATSTPATVRVARLRFVTGNPQVSNVKMYQWDGSTLQPVSVGRWTGSSVEILAN